jgi:hypothetical protein
MAMTIPPVLDWVQSTNLSVAIREGGLPYPVIGGLHLLSIALFGGMLLVTDLRMLGWALKSRTVSDIWYLALPWKRLGLLLLVVTGLLLMWCEPIRLYRSPSFWVKMVLLALVGVHALVFRRSVYEHPEKLDAGITPQARLAAAISLVLWAGIVVAGRMIAFDASFDE